MPWSSSLHPARFESLAHALALDDRADLFLSGQGIAGESRCVVGFVPDSEMIMGREHDRAELSRFCFSSPVPTLGFVSYAYGLSLRGVRPSVASKFPLGCLRKYGAYLEYDLDTRQASIYGPDGEACRELESLVAANHQAAEFARPALSGLRASLDQQGYENGVRQTLQAIGSGQTYQLNLSIRFDCDAPSLDAGALFMHFWQAHPASFYALFRCQGYEMLSTSPERFLKVEDGLVVSQPIKGTLRFDEYQPGLERRVTESAKESAELSMIVDLIRNDISANCEYGSVQVPRHKDTFVVDDLIQMYSEVRGRLREDRTCIDLLLDALPAGSVTGCPKRRSLELIEALEPHARDIYCGSFVVIRSERDMDSNVAIRTAWKDSRSGRLSFCAGSGLVVDSDPHREFLETMAKAGKFLALEGR